MPIAPILWLLAMLVFIVIEAATVNLVALWFVGGALAAMLLALLDVGAAVQLLAFAVVSALLLALFRPLLRKHLAVKKTSTNADRLVGQTAVVTQRIGGGLDAGEVKIAGVLWTALSDAPVEPGQHVTVLRIESTKLCVAPVTSGCNAT